MKKTFPPAGGHQKKGAPQFLRMMQRLAMIGLCFTILATLVGLKPAFGQATRYEAESSNYANATVQSTNTGYSGSGYLTNLNSEWSQMMVERSFNGLTPVQLDIRYANGSGSTITNLSVWQGSNNKIGDLSLASTGSWNTWATATVTFNVPAGYQGIIIKSSANVTVSANIDYLDLTLNPGPTAPGVFSQSAPASGATGVSTTPAFSWNASSSAASYALVVSTSSIYTSPLINQTGLTGTSYTPGTALANSTVYYWKVTATNTSGSTVATNAGISFTTAAAAPVPGSFTQTAPANSATGVSVIPAFSWGSSANASNYSLVVSTSSAFTSPIINQTGLTATSYTPGSGLANNTTYYWKVIATNATSSVVATNAGISFTTATLPAPSVFSQSAPASGATSVSITPAFSWAASANAASYSLVVSTSSAYTSPVINQTGLTATSYTPSTAVTSGTTYYWKVTAINSTGSIVATNAGISFTTGVATPPPSSQPGITREFWQTIPGSGITALTSNPNYPNNPTSTSVLTSFNAPQDIGDNYGQRVKGYLKPATTGSYQFWIASDDDSELWLSTNDQPGNKVKIAYVAGWTNYLQYDKYGSQTSASITLTAGQYYYIEALHKEITGGDNLTVAWQGPGITNQIITSTYLVTAPPTPLPAPGAFTQTTPGSGATGVSLTPAFSWGASTSAESYTLVVSTSSAFTSPVINQSGLTTTSYTPGGGLNGNTTYYWKVTAVNATGSVVATNAGLSFSTLTPPAPGIFSQTAPASSATGISRTPTFTWAAASNASSYSLVVSTSSSYASPLINASGLTSTSYSHSASLAGNTTYYWKVTATNSTGPTMATNAGISFTTSTTTGTYYYVATTGQDAVGRGASGNPFKTIAYAAKQVSAGQNNTIYVNAGTYSETEAIVLPLGVNLEGAGEASVTITSSGPIPAPGIDQSSNDWKLWWNGSLIQLVSASYNNDVALKYGGPTEMTAAANGNQIMSGFTIDGNSKQIKAGVWVQNRNNVTMHHVTIKNCQQRGAVFGRSDMWWYIPLPEGMWMKNTTVYNCTFLNNGAQAGSETLGNLCLAGLDGADIYNITVTDNVGYGIKFIFVGHFRNVKIHDCTITVSEIDAAWGEKISIELWNLSYGNEVYNITCNTWHSYVNHGQITAYEPTGTNTDNLKIHEVKMIDQDGSSSKEAIEAALSGVEIYNCYIQDKGFGIAIWNGQGQTLKKNYIIRNNIFTNVLRTPAFGFGKSSGVFVPDAAQNLKIYNNVFDRMGNGLNLDGVNGADVKNNVFLNTEGSDVENGSGVTFNNNLKYHTNATKNVWNLTGGATLGTGNVIGNPGFQNTGSRLDTYYKPANSGSFSVDKGVNVGLPFVGSAPDMGRWEFGSAARIAAIEDQSKEPTAEDELIVYPNPNNGILHLGLQPGLNITDLEIFNPRGVSVYRLKPEMGIPTEIDLRAYPDDLYLLRVKHEKGIITKKIVLVK